MIAKKTPPRPPRHRPPETDPTPEEIAERAAEIRAGWSETVHRIRAGLKHEPLTTPIVSVRGKDS